MNLEKSFSQKSFFYKKMTFPRIFCKAGGRSSGRHFRCPITNLCKLNLHPTLDGSGFISHLSKHGYVRLFFRRSFPLQHGKVLPTSLHIDLTFLAFRHSPSNDRTQERTILYGSSPCLPCNTHDGSALAGTLYP